MFLVVDRCLVVGGGLLPRVYFVFLVVGRFLVVGHGLLPMVYSKSLVGLLALS